MPMLIDALLNIQRPFRPVESLQHNLRYGDFVIIVLYAGTIFWSSLCLFKRWPALRLTRCYSERLLLAGNDGGFQRFLVAGKAEFLIFRKPVVKGDLVGGLVIGQCIRRTASKRVEQ